MTSVTMVWLLFVFALCACLLESVAPHSIAQVNDQADGEALPLRWREGVQLVKKSAAGSEDIGVGLQSDSCIGNLLRTSMCRLCFVYLGKDLTACCSSSVAFSGCQVDMQVLFRAWDEIDGTSHNLRKRNQLPAPPPANYDWYSEENLMPDLEPHYSVIMKYRRNTNDYFSPGESKMAALFRNDKRGTRGPFTTFNRVWWKIK